MTIVFKETNNNQNDNQGKTFTGRIQVNALEGSNYLAAKVLNKEINDYTFEDSIMDDSILQSKLNTNSILLSPSLILSIGDKNIIGKGYEFDRTSGKYTLTETIEVTTYVGYEGYYVKDGDNIGVFKIIGAEEYNDEYDGDISRLTDYEYHYATAVNGMIKAQDNNGISYTLEILIIM